jgi:30S ribosome assembly GTPase
VSGDNQYCRGCGVIIQTEFPDKPGYIPKIQDRKGQLVCKRCYRMMHYGEVGEFHPGSETIKKNIVKAIALSDLLVIVCDFADVSGSLPVWLDFLAGKPYLLIINKIDLLPVRAKQPEVVEYLKNYLASFGWPAPRDIIMTSGMKGKGVDIWAGRLSKETVPGARIAVLGVTNVGKSSLIKRLLKLEGSAISPTISKFPGTTMGLSNWSVLKGRNTLIDTPGLAPEDRMADLFCPECASALVASQKIEQKLWGLKPDKGLIIGGLCGFSYLGNEETVIIAFSSPELVMHRTENSKINTLLDESPSWLTKICRKCRQKIEWQECTVHLENNQDLAVAGLGWISLRGVAADFTICLPKGVRFEVRPAFIGKKS